MDKLDNHKCDAPSRTAKQRVWPTRRGSQRTLVAMLSAIVAVAACTEDVTPVSTGTTTADSTDESGKTSAAMAVPETAPKVPSSALDAGVAPTTPASTPITTAPINTAPITTAPITTAPINTTPITTAPITTAPITTAPITTAPITTAPITTAPVATVDAGTPGSIVPIPAVDAAVVTMPPAIQVDASAASISPECDAQTKKCNAAGPDLIRDCVAVARRCNPAGAAASPECNKQLDKCEQGPNYLLDCAAVTVVCGL